MDSMEVNKAFAAVLTAGIAFAVAGIVGRTLVHPHRLEHSAIQIGDVAAAAPAAGAPAAAGPEPINVAAANPQNGQQIAQRLCASCHTFTEGGRNGVGPNLAGVVGAPHGHAPGFNYSAALKGKAGNWTYEDLNVWLFKPNQYAPGNRMAFAGITNTQQRADVIAYLRSISPNAPAPQ